MSKKEKNLAKASHLVEHITGFKSPYNEYRYSHDGPVSPTDIADYILIITDAITSDKTTEDQKQRLMSYRRIMNECLATLVKALMNKRS